MIWKDIPGYENLYQISDTTLVKRIVGKSCRKERIVYPHKNKDGYLYISLYKNNKGKTFSIHRLMLESFIGPCPEGKEGCHNDGNSVNNLSWNLRWDTHSKNVHDSIKHKTFVSNLKTKLNKEIIIEIRKLWKEGNLTQRQIAKQFNINRGTVWQIVNYYTWKYVP